ncbi:quinoprotein dehydrogenase-associated putative ABC transporter substrate-binding protein [Halomonas sp. ANAO-440]|uniref:quinoprotein dehydrogenase-associated putative ABC transporter substrate-binding protein n=1 Tax=Halomonas sp. ANAO-440 TaxID=2861360 RepID=UPI001CAA6E2F|nr:quinoprotein dehydrogenase-associated putative ABC transporter substrate-binding protein [Halomonas sp. ANAO-440]MBZ0329987.1 quinoprotein dehydrogenase-associated putative ABC transporter substrate-binding protein [Halomonas sp. ANAO-440]
MRSAIGFLLLSVSLALGVGSAVADLPERQDREALRVCMDGNNMPFSNEAGDGFENRIAELMAEDMGVPLAYVWAPQVMGFVRNTLELRVCDVIIGAVAGYEFVQNTNEYYRSVYTLVVPAASGIEATSLEDPSLQGLRIGVVAETPPMVALRGTGAVVVGYPLMVDTRVRAPVRDAVEDVAAGNTDGAVLWGPLAGHYASLQNPPLRVLPLVDDTSGARLDYRITMGIRRGEPHWKDWINDFIDRHQEEIHAILREYRVPLLDRRGQLIVPDNEGTS